ncbi:hypothetical protein L208DRAFT_11682 [Tricholoma matsutake]|nr:hypothetical protein L208DRAFT_11682 [Tricholoma matsutake 945]
MTKPTAPLIVYLFGVLRGPQFALPWFLEQRSRGNTSKPRLQGSAQASDNTSRALSPTKPLVRPGSAQASRAR